MIKQIMNTHMVDIYLSKKDMRDTKLFKSFLSFFFCIVKDFCGVCVQFLSLFEWFLGGPSTLVYFKLKRFFLE